jgi:site-specific DNA recombinase
MAIRVGLYARYSTDMQNDASIEDQLRVCREYASRQGWIVVDSYSDRAKSGASLVRPGLQDLIQDAANRRFEAVLAEALDRFSRDQEDIAGIFKRMTYVGVQMATVAEGEVNEMHIGLKGTMNALFLKDLAAKTHRGLRGRVEAGKSGGGNAYGYKVVRRFGPDNTPVAGDREIDAAEAEVIRRILTDFVNGQSPRAIAFALNQEGIPGPRGKEWGQSTINGHAERGTGILNNELYVGRLVWNRLRYIKDPRTGKRVSRPNASEKLVVTEVPVLRIISDELWRSVKARQTRARKTMVEGAPPPDDVRTLARPRKAFWVNQRPQHLLSGLMRCGSCGGNYTKINRNLFGCSVARNKGTCNNRLNIRVDVLEVTVLEGLKSRLMNPDVYKEFLAGYISERNTIIAHRNAHFTGAREELTRVKSKIRTLVNLLAEGGSRSLLEDLTRLESREDELNATLENQPAEEPAMHPQLAEVYRARVGALHEALNHPQTRDEAFGMVRTLIDEVRLVPECGDLRLEIRGALAGILALGLNKSRNVQSNLDGSVSILVEQIKLVAGARNPRNFTPLKALC